MSVPAWSIAAGTAFVMLSGCGGPTLQTDAAHPVIALPAQATDGAQALRLPGEVHARYEMPLSFRVAGQLAVRLARLGDTVRRGQVLAKLDDSDPIKTASVARAAMHAAEERLAFATRQRDRDESQMKQNLISQLQLEQTHDAYASALAARDQAKDQVVLAQNQLRYAMLIADHDGAITAEHAQVGQVVTAGQPIFDFAWSSERDVYLDVPQDRLAEVSVGQSATVSVTSVPGNAWAGHVREVSPAADPQSRTYRIKIAIDAPDPRIALGMTAEVALPTAQRVDPVRIAATALFHEGDRPAVWVVRPSDSRLELRAITVLRYGERDVLVNGGLRAGERVVMQGVHTVWAGEKVEPVSPPHAEDAPS